MEKVMENIYSYIILYGVNILAAIAIFVIGRFAAKFVSNVIATAFSKTKINSTLASFTKHVAYYGIMTFVIIAALNKIGIETSSFIAVVGAASLAVGLALQGSLSNFASGVMLILFHYFKVGDTIEAGGAFGRVDEIQIFHTIIISPDKSKRIIVPNSKITGDKITVELHEGERK